MESWLLTMLIFLPLVGIPVISLLDERHAARIRLYALTASVASLVVTIVAVVGFFIAVDGDGEKLWTSGKLALEQRIAWIEPGGLVGPLRISYHLGIDGISVWLVVLTA